MRTPSTFRAARLTVEDGAQTCGAVIDATEIFGRKIAAASKMRFEPSPSRFFQQRERQVVGNFHAPARGHLDGDLQLDVRGASYAVTRSAGKAGGMTSRLMGRGARRTIETTAIEANEVSIWRPRNPETPQ